MVENRYFRLARYWALFCPAFVACPYNFTDILEIFGHHTRCSPVFVHYNFKIPYIEAKRKVKGAKTGGRNRDPRFLDLRGFAEFWVS